MSDSLSFDKDHHQKQFSMSQISLKNKKVIQKYSDIINFDARKGMVFSQIINPKVSQIQCENEDYEQFKYHHLIQKDQILSQDFINKSKFDKIKEKINNDNVFKTQNLNLNEKWMNDSQIINTFSSSNKSRGSSNFVKERQL